MSGKAGRKRGEVGKDGGMWVRVGGGGRREVEKGGRRRGGVG